MAPDGRVLSVEIHGQRYPIRTTLDPDYVLRLAAFVDQKIGAVAEALATTVPCPVEFVGVKDTFGSSGEPDELAYAYEIAAPFIAAAARKVLKRKK